MAWLWNLNLIRFFDFYLAFLFLVSIVLRVRQYLTVLRLVTAVPGRWPKLFALVKQRHTVFLTRSTILPGLLAFALMGLQVVASRFLWPHANLTLGHLAEMPVAVPIVSVLGLAMFAFDAVAAWWVGEVDQAEMEKSLDQAEYWLKSWTAPVVSVVTFGYLNPRKMVLTELDKALNEATKMLSFTLWWLIVQAALRIAFGLALWCSYAFSPG
jgi:hypothetical protein